MPNDFQQGFQNHLMEKNSLVNGARTTGWLHAKKKKMKLDPYLTPHKN